MVHECRKGNMHVSAVLSLPGVMLITNVNVAIHEGRAADGLWTLIMIITKVVCCKYWMYMIDL